MLSNVIPSPKSKFVIDCGVLIAISLVVDILVGFTYKINNIIIY